MNVNDALARLQTMLGVNQRTVAEFRSSVHPYETQHRQAEADALALALQWGRQIQAALELAEDLRMECGCGCPESSCVSNSEYVEEQLDWVLAALRTAGETNDVG